jgi:ATP-binding cassette, subfamily C, bacterial CydD
MKPLDPRLLLASRSARLFLAAAVATGVVRTAATIAIAWGIAAAITEAIDADHIDGLADRIAPTLVLLALAFAVRAAAAWATDDLAARAAARVKGELRRAVLERAAERGPSWLAERSSAGFATTLGPGLDALDAYFGRYLPQLVLTAIATPVLIVAIGFGDLTSGIIVLCAMPVIPLFMILIGMATQTLQRKQQDALARLGGAFLEAVEGLATLKVFGRARRQVDRIGTITDRYRNGTLAVLRLSFVSGFALELAASLAVALVAISIGVRLVDGTLGLGAALFVLVLAPEAFAPIRQVGADFHAAQDGVEASAQVLDVLDPDAEPAAAPAPDPIASPAEIARLVASADRVPRRRVIAAGTDLVLRGLAVVRDGRRIGPVTALTGPSGSGKTSLLAAIRGVVEADGTVSVPGDPSLQTIRRTTWMDQRPRLVGGTVADNVTMGAPADDAAVRAALAAAALDVDPATVLGAGGSGLSGGQAQRVALARAVLRADRERTPLVLLDEPTSALDAEAEQRAIAAMRRLADGGAVVVVASHRPAVVAASDGRLDLRPSGVVRSGAVRLPDDAEVRA